jgi:hypothetical protein
MPAEDVRIGQARVQIRLFNSFDVGAGTEGLDSANVPRLSRVSQKNFHGVEEARAAAMQL